VKRMEPWLTTTRAIATSADRMDGTAANIMEAYYKSIDNLHDSYPILDEEPSRTLNFDELSLNNRGEYAEETLQAFTSIALLKLLRGRTPHRTTALNDGSGNVTLIPFILGGNILLADAFIGAVETVKPDWSAPAKWTQRNANGMPFLPGMRGDHFEGKRTRVFATESGSNNSLLLEYMLIEWCVFEVVCLFIVQYCIQDNSGVAQDPPRWALGDFAGCSERSLLDPAALRVLRCERNFHCEVSAQLHNNDTVS